MNYFSHYDKKKISNDDLEIWGWCNDIKLMAIAIFTTKELIIIIMIIIIIIMITIIVIIIIIIVIIIILTKIQNGYAHFLQRWPNEYFTANRRRKKGFRLISDFAAC